MVAAHAVGSEKPAVTGRCGLRVVRWPREGRREHVLARTCWATFAALSPPAGTRDARTGRPVRQPVECRPSSLIVRVRRGSATGLRVRRWSIGGGCLAGIALTMGPRRGSGHVVGQGLLSDDVRRTGRRRRPRNGALFCAVHVIDPSDASSRAMARLGKAPGSPGGPGVQGRYSTSWETKRARR